MADVALYRKYRPQNFKNLMGQEHVSTTLLNAIKGGHLSHAYLFCGPRGTGKTTAARLVAKAINCISPQPDGESCNKCEYCTAMNETRLVDLIEIDAASNRGIDEIRDLREKIKFTPNQAPHKVYIIDEVHMLTTPAFNALLKTLEEPPAHAYFILATTEAHKVPDTIISRCQRFDFRRIAEDVVVERLKHIAKHEQIEVEEDALAWISRASEGGLRDAIGFFDQVISDGKLTQETVTKVLGLTGHMSVNKLHEALETGEVKTALTEVQNLHRSGNDLSQFNREFLNFLRERLLESLSKKEAGQKYLRWIELFQKASQELKTAVIPQLPLEIAVIKACMTPEEEAKTGWFGGILGGKKETPPATSSKAEKAAKALEEEGLKPLPAEPAPENEVGSVLSPSKSSSTSADHADLTLESVREHFPRVLEAIPTASVRHSFKTGVVSHVENGSVSVDFQSKFHLEKVETAVGQSEIEAAFLKVFGQKVQVNCRLVVVKELVDAALEIFGGEVIE